MGILNKNLKKKVFEKNISTEILEILNRFQILSISN